MNDYTGVIEALEQSGAYPERPASIEHLQTHISHLFLTPDYVYKVKKPVDFGFLDFSTFEKRRSFCYEELVLNQRTSPDVYLEVVKIRRGPGGRIAVDGSGQVLEHAVKMRRLPAASAMDQLLATDQVSESMARDLGSMVAAFHGKAAATPEISAYGSPEGVAQNVIENFDQTEPFVGRTISAGKHQRLKAYSETFLIEQRPLLERRAAEGFVRDCHGDLHAAQVFFTDQGVRIIDCIEFTKRFRYTDVVSDMAFMAMDLDYAERPDLSRVFMESWLEVAQDPDAAALLDFYKVYRACVRGKVEGFRLDDPHVPKPEKDAAAQRARHYFNLAYYYISKSEQPRLILSAGMIGTGKSTVARYVASDSGMALLSSDSVRKRLAGVPATERHYEPFGTGIYAPEFSQRTYQALFTLAGEYLSAGHSVVLDATFGRRAQRDRAAALAAEYGADFWVVECVAEEPIIEERLRRRQQRGTGVSDGRLEIYEREKSVFEPMDDVPPDHYVRMDTSVRTVAESVSHAQLQLGIDPV